MLATIALSYWVISSELKAQRYGYKYQATDSLSAPSYNPQAHRISLSVFSYYCLLIHVLVFAFPLRSCWAVLTIASSLRKSARSKSLDHLRLAHVRRGSSTSLSSSETLTSSRDLGSTSSSESGDLDPELFHDGDIAPDRVIHAIIIPNYKEENDTLRETLEVLASHPQARNTYDVCRCVVWAGWGGCAVPLDTVLSGGLKLLGGNYPCGWCLEDFAIRIARRKLTKLFYLGLPRNGGT